MAWYENRPSAKEMVDTFRQRRFVGRGFDSSLKDFHSNRRRRIEQTNNFVSNVAGFDFDFHFKFFCTLLVNIDFVHKSTTHSSTSSPIPGLYKFHSFLYILILKFFYRFVDLAPSVFVSSPLLLQTDDHINQSKMSPTLILTIPALIRFILDAPTNAPTTTKPY